MGRLGGWVDGLDRRHRQAKVGRSNTVDRSNACIRPSVRLPTQVTARLAAEDRILVGGAYSGPGARNPSGEAGKSLRFVTHLQTPRVAVRALLGGLAKHLRHV